MTADTARSLVLRCLSEIAPDADLDALAGDADLRETLDLDSMDMFNLVAAIAEEGGVEIPDRDAGRLTTLDGAVGYLAGDEVTGHA
jgi:acyl carrier protein